MYGYVQNNPVIFADPLGLYDGTINYGGNVIPYTNGSNGRELAPIPAPTTEAFHDTPNDIIKFADNFTGTLEGIISVITEKLGAEGLVFPNAEEIWKKLQKDLGLKAAEACEKRKKR